MNNNKRIALNSIVIFIRLCITTVVSLFASRLVLDALGASDYGLYNVVGGIVVLLNVVNSAMTSTTYRFIAYEIGRGNDGESNKVFNTSFVIHVCFAILIVLLAVSIGELYISKYLQVQEGKLPDARFVFRISIVTTVMSTITVPYRGLLVAYEKFTFSAIVEIVAQVLKLGAIYFLLYRFPCRIRTYSLIMMGYTFFECFAFFAFCLKNYFSIIKFKPSFEKGLYGKMLSFAVWTLFGAVASVGRNQGSAIILNLFFGTIVNAAYAVATQVNTYITMFARSLDNAAIPQITKSFSGGDKNRSLRLSSYISKYTFFLMLIVAFPALMEMDFLLGLWLKDVPEGTTSFCRIIMLTALFDCLGEGIPALVNATGNIKLYQIIFHSFTISGLPIAYVLCKIGAGQYSLPWVFCTIMALSAILRLILLKKIYKIDIKIFISTSYSKILFVSIPLAICYAFYNPVNFSSGGHVIGLVGSEILLVLAILLLGLDNYERQKIKGLFRSLKKKLL